MNIPEITAIRIHEVLVPTPASLQDDWVCFSKVPIHAVHILCHYEGIANMSPQECDNAKKFATPTAFIVITCPTFEVGQQVEVTLNISNNPHWVYSTYGALSDDRVSHWINKLIYEAFNEAGIT